MRDLHVEAHVILLTPQPIAAQFLIGDAVEVEGTEHLGEDSWGVAGCRAVHIEGAAADFHAGSIFYALTSIRCV